MSNEGLYVQKEHESAEAMTWLERSRDSKSPSNAKVHASSLLAYIKQLERHRDALNAENASLNAESRSLLESWSERGARIKQLEGERDDYRARVEHFRSDPLVEVLEAAERENERLREALEYAVQFIEATYAPGEELPGGGRPAAEVRGRAALARTEEQA